MRRIIFGSYDTAADGQLTLTSWQLSDPEYKAVFVTVPGRDGDLDLSTALTDADPRYNNRVLTATFESSEGTRIDRQSIFDDFRHQLDGQRVKILLPDDDLHYLTGRARVAIQYNDNAHGALTVTANCEPWRYAVTETAHILSATEEEQRYVLDNYGRRALVPTVAVTGTIALSAGDNSWNLSAGTYALPDLALRRGGTVIMYSGSGTVTVTYREAIL